MERELKYFIFGVVIGIISAVLAILVLLN